MQSGFLTNIKAMREDIVEHNEVKSVLSFVECPTQVGFFF